MTYIGLLKKILQLNITTKPKLNKLKRNFCKSNNLSQLPTDIKLLAELKKQSKKFSSNQYQKLAKLLQVRPMRTLSGVSILTVLTKPWPCPGKCVYCPSEADMPKSYLK